MTVQKKIWFIRHASSGSDTGQPTSGPENIALTSAGEEQAVELAASVTEKPDLIITSPFRRAQQTAEPLIAKYPDVRTETWPLQEFTYLSTARTANTTFAQRKPMTEKYWADADPEYRDGDGAESFSDLIARVQAAFDKLKTTDGDFIIVITHGQVMQVVRLLVAYPGLPPAALMAQMKELQRQDPFPNIGVVPLILADGEFQMDLE